MEDTEAGERKQESGTKLLGSIQKQDELTEPLATEAFTEQQTVPDIEQPLLRRLPSDVISAFNGLRGFFVLSVLFYHAFMNWKEYGIEMYGYQGVDGFLIMSGWLNSASLDKGFDKKSKGRNLKDFFIHRALRIRKHTLRL